MRLFWHMWRVLIVFILFACSACAASHSGRAVQSALAAKQSIEIFSEQWAQYVDRKIETCRETLPPASSPNARMACLGAAARSTEVVAAVDAVIAVNTSIFLAATCSAAHTPLVQCVSQDSATWLRLISDLRNALAVLVPFVGAMQNDR